MLSRLPQQLFQERLHPCLYARSLRLARTATFNTNAEDIPRNCRNQLILSSSDIDHSLPGPAIHHFPMPAFVRANATDTSGRFQFIQHLAHSCNRQANCFGHFGQGHSLIIFQACASNLFRGREEWSGLSKSSNVMSNGSCPGLVMTTRSSNTASTATLGSVAVEILFS